MNVLIGLGLYFAMSCFIVSKVWDESYLKNLDEFGKIIKYVLLFAELLVAPIFYLAAHIDYLIRK